MINPNISMLETDSSVAGTEMIITQDASTLRVGKVTVDAIKTYVETGAFTPGSLDLSSTIQTTHPINLEGLTLASNTNAIRGASVNPTRTSGWISFSGTVSTSPAQVYTDYRQLTTTGVAEVLGIGSFPTMATGASCASAFGLQSICQVDSGATVLTASGAPAVGIFPVFAKVLIDGATFNSGGVASCAFLSFQANVTDVSSQDTSMINMEVASGGINSIMKFQCTASAGATYFVNFENNGYPAEKLSASTTQTNNVVGAIAVLIGDQVGYINVHSAKAA